MNDEQFEHVLTFIQENWHSGQELAGKMRARDTAQREEIAELRAALATQPAAGEPAAWECFDGRYASLSYEREGDPDRAVPLFRAAPPAAARGDEAVRISKLLELADQHAERRLADARSDEAAAAELEISEEDEAANWYGACIGAADTARATAAIIKSLTDEIRSRTAMRAQGDGEFA